jgi:outer membrane immunogenic protein
MRKANHKNLAKGLTGLLATSALVVAGTAALAADLPPYPSSQPYNSAPPNVASMPWAGWQVGALLGYGIADTDLTAAAGTANFDADGVLGGVLVGWSWQTGDFVYGFEGDWVAADLTDSQTFGANRVNASVDWMAEIRARAGYLLAPELLLFGMVGYAWADIDLPVTGVGGGSGSDTFSGWQFGGGLEYRFDSNWSTRLDYLYTDLDSESITYSGQTVTYDPDVHAMRAGLVYKF